MDGKGFQAFGGARADARAAARGARGAVGPERGRGIEAAIELGVDEARRCPHCASEGAVSRGMARGLRRYQCKGCGRTFNALRYAAVGLAPQGTLAVVRGVAGEGGDGEGLGGALRRGGEHGVPLASPVSGGGAERFGGAQGDRGSGRDLRPGEPEGRARAGTQGTAAGRQGEEARPFARAGAGSHGGGPERDDGQRCAAQGRCGGAPAALDPVAEGRPAGLYPTRPFFGAIPQGHSSPPRHPTRPFLIPQGHS